MLSWKPSTLSFFCSAMLHLALLSAVILPNVPTGKWGQTLDTELQAVASGQSPGRMEGIPGPQWEVDASSDPPAVESTSGMSVDAPLSGETPGLAEFSRSRLEQARAQQRGKSSAEQLADLEKLGRQLDRIATEESVSELSGTLSQWLGAGERATHPVESADGHREVFDIETAQISEVRRVETDESGVNFVAVLIDAAGHSQEALLDDADGRQLYQTFQLMKRFPLLEKVYRRTVMGLLDKLAVQPANPADSTAPPEG